MQQSAIEVILPCHVVSCPDSTRSERELIKLRDQVDKALNTKVLLPNEAFKSGKMKSSRETFEKGGHPGGKGSAYWGPHPCRQDFIRRWSGGLRAEIWAMLEGAPMHPLPFQQMRGHSAWSRPCPCPLEQENKHQLCHF